MDTEWFPHFGVWLQFLRLLRGLSEEQMVHRLALVAYPLLTHEYRGIEEGAYLPLDVEALLKAIHCGLDLDTMAMGILVAQLGYDIATSLYGPSAACWFWYQGDR
jgi:hypothetical protein